MSIESNEIQTPMKRYQCTWCSKSYANAQHFKAHIKKHEQGLHMCPRPKCCKSYTSQEALDQHTERHTEKNRPHRCLVCTSSFTLKKNLNAHAAIHSEERKHTCPICNKAFTQRASLINHKKIHDKSYPCLECEEGQVVFDSKAGWTEHMAMEHSGESKCPVCDKVLLSKKTFLQHIARHKGSFECFKCGSRFGQNWELQKHLKWHDDETVNECRPCGKHFLHQYLLTRHLESWEHQLKSQMMQNYTLGVSSTPSSTATNVETTIPGADTAAEIIETIDDGEITGIVVENKDKSLIKTEPLSIEDSASILQDADGTQPGGLSTNSELDRTYKLNLKIEENDI